MKLAPRDAARYFSRPDPDKAGMLIYGADAMRVALKRQEFLNALLGDNADEEMRLTRMGAAELRGDPAQLIDAVKAVGFFPGPRAVLVEDAGDGAAPAVTAALQDWCPGDAQIVVTAGSLKPASKLRKQFEAHDNTYAAGIYDDPPTREEIARRVSAAGLGEPARDSLEALSALAAELGPGGFALTLEKVSLYKQGDDTPLTPEEIAACAPLTTEAALDDILYAVAEERSGDIGPLMRRLAAQGTSATGLCIGAQRHFRLLLALAAHPDGAASGAARQRPPLFGKRRDRIVRQAQKWRAEKLQKALTLLTDTDLQLRSAGRSAPDLALVERALIRIAMSRPER